MARRIALALAAIGALLGSGCGDPEKELLAKADWLCRYDQLKGPTLAVAAPSIDLRPYVAAADLRKAEAARGQPLVGGPLTAAALAFKALGPVAVPVIEATARATRCEIVSLAVEGDLARLEVARTAPVLDFKVFDLEALSKAPPEARVDMVASWLKPGLNRASAPLTLVRTSDGWRATWEPPSPPRAP